MLLSGLCRESRSQVCASSARVIGQRVFLHFVPRQWHSTSGLYLESLLEMWYSELWAAVRMTVFDQALCVAWSVSALGLAM